MTNEQRGRLEQASGIGKGIWFKNKDTRERECWGKVDDEVFIIVGEETDNPYKHLIQRIVPASGQTWDDSMYFYRSGYYNFGGAGRKKLVWG
jgi:hypothetical protein